MCFRWILFSLIVCFTVEECWCQVRGKCPTLTLANGRVRLRRNRAAMFFCNDGFQLIGYYFSTCRRGEWTVPPPICAKPGCGEAKIENGYSLSPNDFAVVTFFCLPGFKLTGLGGGASIWCDGESWNTTLPSCVADAKEEPKLSCDFEQDLCGWNHDSTDDFDWERLNRKTPSSFLKTGPSYDHTLGEGHDGYYMYIESSHRLVNDTARLISPIYDKTIVNNACFSFFYHMYGRDIGGLRIFQKPESVEINDLGPIHLLFELWGNQGDSWWGEFSQLSDYGEDFQIVIEGIRGRRFTSDIAIDDVAIQNCSSTKQISTPTPIVSESCEGRCNNKSARNPGDCGCDFNCFDETDCCHDFFNVCLFADVTDSAENKPTISTTTTTTTTTTTVAPETTKTPTTSTTKMVQSTTASTTQTAQATKTYENVTIFQKDEIAPKNDTSTKPLKFWNTTDSGYSPDPSAAYTKSTTYVTRVQINDKNPITTSIPRIVPRNGWSDSTKEKELDAQTAVKSSTTEKTSAWKPFLITIAVLACCVGAAWAFVALRGARGRSALAALRGRTTHDPEVRYLHSDSDEL